MSVGHVARGLEEAGIPTVTIMTRAFAHRATEMTIPRSLVVKHPMGRCLGAPFDRKRHHEILDAAFDVLETATHSGTIVEFAQPYRAGH